jgi:hypothetical protein
MRRRATWVVTGGLALVGLAAVVDVFWERAETSSPGERPREATGEDSPASDFRRARVSGTLYFTVRVRQGCELRTVSLPEARISTSIEPTTCLVEVSPSGQDVAQARSCPAQRSAVHDVLVIALTRGFIGCAPAWKPSGALTYVRNGEVVEEELACLGQVSCAKVVLSRREIARGLRSFAQRLGRFSLAGIAWFSDSRLAAVIHSSRFDNYPIALFEGREHLDFIDFPFRDVPQIDAIPGVKEIIIGTSESGFLPFDPDGRVSSPSRIPFADVVAVAASPDGRWLALARPGNVCIHASRDGRTPIECLPVDAVDLVWR